MRHQQILDIAAEQSELSMEEIAAEVPSATMNLVEQVLDEYGDPATGAHGPTVSAANEDGDSGNQDHEGPAPEQHLTDAELEVLRAIHANPTASQRTLAESLDLSAATISKRATAIEGLEWEERDEFVRELFDANPHLIEEDENMHGDLSDEARAEIDRIGTELDNLAERIDSLAEEHSSSGCFENPALTHKVIHACMQSEEFSSDEELAVIQSITN
jgi:DNA-binding Lrp family transcriptional regulator